MGIDPRFLAESGREVFVGNELLVKGALETEGGVHLLTGYPGSPVAGFFDILGDLKDLLKSKGIKAFQANNEALGVAAVNGSQMAPVRAICAFKSVGTHVASDALALGTLAGAHPQGGAVIISGEDPWCDSTQVPADSRFLFEHLRMPVVEPGTLQELKDWIGLSFKLSQAAGLYIGYIVTVAQADGGGTVECRPNQFPTDINTNRKFEIDTAAVPVDKTVLLPPRTWRKELQNDERYRVTMERARELGINRIYPASARGTGASPVQQSRSDGFEDRSAQTHGRGAHATEEAAPIGFITTGMGRPYLDHVLADIGLSGQFPILNLGMSYPVDVNLVAEFSKLCVHMIVIEERRSFLEKNIRDAAFKFLAHEDARDVVSRLFGKKFPNNVEGIPDTRGLNYSVLAQKLIPLIQSTQEIPAELRNGKLTAEMRRLREASKPKLQVISEKIVARTPTFCPGCPHRDSSSVLLEVRKNFADAAYMKRVHNRGTVDMVAHGDTGCYTMLMFAPTEQLMHNYSGMGLGGGTGSGIDPFITNKQIVFMGDGTFFHSGQLAISNSIKGNQDITYIILENGTTAMTGHQEHAGLSDDILGNMHYIQDIEKIVRGMAAHAPIKILKGNPADRDEYKKALEKTILSDGVKIIIADKECGITYNRTKSKQERAIMKEKGFLPRKDHMNVTPEVCEDCRECTKATACPGLTVIDTDYGKKIDTDLTWCVNDGACERVRSSNDYGTSVKPCPSFEQVTVIRQKRRRYTLPNMQLDKLPEPGFVHDMTARGASWRLHMAGVGGMGIGLVGAILVRAGHKEGYRVIFQDKKGLAIRNGGVYAQMTFIQDSLHAGAERSAAPDSSYPTTGSIPYGKADLLLGVDILEATRATDPREQFRVAHKDRTCAVLNLHKQPTVYTLLGKDDFDPDELRDEIFAHCRPDHSYAKNLSKISEERLGSKQFVNIMMLGTAYQLGLIPVSAHSIAWAIKDTIRREHRRNLKAFNIGRKLALEPRALPLKPEPETWHQLVVNKARILRKTKIKGRIWGDDYERLVETAMKVMRGLPENSKYDLALRIYDLMQYEDFHYAKRYMDLVRGVYKRDNATQDYAATQAAIWNLAKVMLIKDEPYVAYLLTRYEKKVRDIAKYGIDESNGDKLVYRHHTSPEFNIGKHRIRFKITTSDWQLNLVRHAKFLRKLPGWHKRETAFRDWYIALLDRVSLSATNYDQAIRILKCTEPVTGYREIRYPKMDAAREQVERELGAAPPKVEMQMKRTVLDVFRTPAGV
ncbi:MAG: indolepyruvate ferredoxin oxidoreductase [Phycisphaerales bacterium]|jgi:indolepyruvate ferredoxin oxidoreductase|nr:indolepyruvate ferredoxin oxidoreductase [Phycisphaerales bacterium]